MWWRSMHEVRTVAASASQYFERARALGWRKRAVECREILIVKLDASRVPVLADTCNVGGLRDHDRADLPQQPGERDLRRRCVAAARNVLQRGVSQQTPLLDRRIGHDGDVPFAAGRN